MVLVPLYDDDGVTQLTDDLGNILVYEDGTAGLLTFVAQAEAFWSTRSERVTPACRRFADYLPPLSGGGGGGRTFYLTVGVIFQLPPPRGQVV